MQDYLVQILSRANGDLVLWQMLDMLNAGKSDTEIATTLHLSRWTVNRMKRRFFKRAYVLHEHVAQQMLDFAGMRRHSAERLDKLVQEAHIIRVTLNEQRKIVAGGTEK